MRKHTRKTIELAVLAVVTSLLFVNCSKNEFSSVPGPSSAGPNTAPAGSGGGDPNTGAANAGNATNTADGSVAGSGGAYGGTSGGSSPPTPTITYYAPKCQAGTLCPVTFKISGGGALLAYNWSTNDSKYGQPAPAGLASYGMAGVDYVSTYGSMSFASGGSDTIVIHIRNISTRTSEITIPLLFSGCVYAGHPINCTDLKFTGVQQI